ncbi:dipeptidase [Saxibacter everestensis]|uniref:Dipeptidase n=1 Tax=Saxibacter everestensis TaxID=2909229 RepID=A0ABY8QVE2_9MICO|nr:dipeptidase [Brevibacteriaceae bacterium ZFBP1038]
MQVPGLLDATPLIDGHNDLPAALREKAGYSVARLDVERPELHTDIVKLRQGKVGGQFWSVWVPSDISEDAAVVATLEQVDAVHRIVAAYPDTFGLACTADDVERVFGSGRIASLIGIEGGHSIAESLGALRMFGRLGVRYMTLTHNDDTSWAASATGVRQSTGLNEAGRAIVTEMNRIGMIVDLSHTAESTQLDALATTSAPVIFSHSSARAVADHPRNVSDAVLAELAGNGGVVQITFVPGFISQPCVDWRREMLAKRVELGLDPHTPQGHPGSSALRSDFAVAPKPGESLESVRRRNDELLAADEDEGKPAEARAALNSWIEENPRPEADLSDVVSHLEHAREAAGIDHIGIGGDYDGTSTLPIGLENVSRYPALFSELASRGWSGADLQKLAGRNVLRVMRAVEHAAHEPLWPEC